MRLLAYGSWGLAVALFYVLLAPAPATRQPLAFNHAKHSPMACRICHAGVEMRAEAGLPKSSLCAGCHARSPRAEEVADWKPIEARGDVAWVSLLRVPGHVYFSHQTHVKTAQIACRNCHGDIERRETPPPRPLVSLDMKACLGCHESHRASSDCASCHR